MSLRAAALTLTAGPAPTTPLTGGPHAATLAHAHGIVAATLDEARKQILATLDATISQLVSLTQDPQLVAWKLAYHEAKQRYEVLREQLKSEGVDPDQVLAYSEEARKRVEELVSLDAKIASLDALRATRRSELDALDAAWRRETQLRREAGEALMREVPQTSVKTPFVTIEVVAYGDDSAFKEHIKAEIRGGAKFNVTEVESLADALIKHTPPGTPPTHLLSGWAEAFARGETPVGSPWSASDKKAQTLLGILTPEKLGELCLWRVPDRVRITLYRHDGRAAGELEDGLSVGQRCTAILAVLLAQDSAPVIIDQPEDDLDNEFIFNELVPLIRHVKNQRQVIIATHNANIPVNGDAELVVALHYDAGRGTIKKVDGELALGSLDADSVKHSVTEIMEGGTEAFRRRQARYGY